MNFAFAGVTPWPDWWIVAGLVATMLVSQKISYWVGGYIWVERHSIHLRLFGKDRQISGFYGEAFTTMVGGGLMVTIGALTPSISLYDLIFDHLPIFYAVLAVSFVLYVFYAISVVGECKRNEGHRGRKHHRKLARTYVTYAPYSICLYLGVIAAVLLLVMQYFADAAAIDAQRLQIIKQMHTLAPPHGGTIEPAKIQAGIEIVYGKMLVNGSKVAASMNPVFVLIALATSIMFLLERSPIRNVFLNLPRSMAQSMGVIALLFFFLLTTITYYFSYSQLAREALRCISGLGPVLERGHADWEIMRRFNEIVIDLGRKHSFIGFASTVIDESGAAVVWMALLQWATSRGSAAPNVPQGAGTHGASKGK